MIFMGSVINFFFLLKIIDLMVGILSREFLNEEVHWVDLRWSGREFQRRIVLGKKEQRCESTVE